MRAPWDSYVQGEEKRSRPGTTKRCTRCKQRKSIRDCYHRHKLKADGYQEVCKTCRRKEYSKRQRRTVTCCTTCGTPTNGRHYCEPCRLEQQAIAEKAFEESSPPAPTICGLPSHGKTCPHAVSDTCDREGRGVIYCPVHGYRMAPVIRPPNFVRYDQRERLDEEIGAFIARAQAEVDPEVSARNQGSSKRGTGFVVGGAHGATWIDEVA